MNKYLIKIADSINKKNNDIRDTAVIGAAGSVASMATHGISEAMEHKGGPGFLNRVGGFLKTPIKDMVRTPGFRKTLKIGAIGTGVGLAADYAAVKLNKHLEKGKN